MMVMPDTNPATSIRCCRFLDKLPVELRLSIYEFFFQGSQIHATLANHDESSFTQDAAVIMRHSEHFKLLLGCRTIYNEALATYWSKTILRLSCPTPRLLSCLFTFVRGNRLKLHKNAHRLYISLPGAVKANVKHIRGMVLPELRGAFVEENPSLTASVLLGTFKELATCEFSPIFDYPVSELRVSHTMNPKNKGFNWFKMRYGRAPTDYLADCYGLDATAGVTFLCKGAMLYPSDTDEENTYASLTQRLPQFRNLSTGLAFEDVTRNLDDEEGYEKVMQGNLDV